MKDGRYCSEEGFYARKSAECDVELQWQPAPYQLPKGQCLVCVECMGGPWFKYPLPRVVFQTFKEFITHVASHNDAGHKVPKAILHDLIDDAYEYGWRRPVADYGGA